MEDPRDSGISIRKLEIKDDWPEAGGAGRVLRKKEIKEINKIKELRKLRKLRNLKLKGLLGASEILPPPLLHTRKEASKTRHS